MKEPAGIDFTCLPLSAKMRVDELCNRFEKAWNERRRPRIEDYLSQVVEAERAALLRQLLLTELELRNREREQPGPAEYERRFVGYGELVRAAFRDAAARAGGQANTPRSGQTPVSGRSDRGVAGEPKWWEEVLAPERGADRGQTATLPQGQDWPTVPGYEIRGLLGRGGMGVVYEARQVGLDRVVALKMIRDPDLAGEEERARFRTEAQAAARLQHPNIVQIHEVGEHNGLPYFTLEYVCGSNLAQMLRGVPLPPREATRLVEQLARAVHCAHQKGIIHRDLKPGNVLMTEDGTPKVTDFGLAKRVDTGSSLTATGAVVGTPSYMAPEQAEGKKEIALEADVYALGAILYECLTGRPPFQGPTPLDVLVQVVGNEPVPPTQLQPKVPRDLETICLKCLQKRPEKRYASAGQLADRLRMVLEGKPIPDRPVGALERAWKWARRRPAVAATYALLLVVAVLGSVGGVATWLWQQSESGRRQAEELRQQAEGARQEAEGLRQRAEEARQAAEKAQQSATQARDQLADAHRQLQVLRYARNLDVAQKEWETFNLVRAEAILDDCPKELRNWEWRHLTTCCRRRALTLRGHTLAVGSVAFSPDRQRLATAGCGDLTVKVWDVRSGKNLLTLRGHTHHVRSVAFSPDGERLASGSLDATVKVWDARSGQEVLTLKGASATVAFSPDGNRVASGSADRTVKVWDARSGQEVLTLKHPEGVGSVAFSPDGQRLASGSEDKTVKVWDARSGQELLTLKGHAGRILGVAFSPDGNRVASASEDRTVKVWDTHRGQELFSLQDQGYFNSATSVAFSPDGQRLISGTIDGTVKVWDASNGQELFTLKGQAGWVLSVAFSPDGQRLAAGSADGSVKVWDASAPAP